MAAPADIRATIHSLWEAFVPSALAFAAFAWIWISLVGFSYAQLLFHPVLEAARYVQGQNQLIKEFELLKLVPFLALLFAATALYLFDRVVGFLGRLTPPFLIWRGSTALYVSEYSVRELWNLLPNVTNPAALDFEARVVLSEAEAEKKLPQRNSIEYLSKRFSSASRFQGTSKVAAVWVLACFVWALSEGQPFAGTAVKAMIFEALAVVAWFGGVLWTTESLLRMTEEEMRMAISILYAKNVRPDHSDERRTAFDTAFKNSENHAPRMIGLRWGSLRPAAQLWRALFGIKRDISRWDAPQSSRKGAAN